MCWKHIHVHKFPYILKWTSVKLFTFRIKEYIIWIQAGRPLCFCIWLKLILGYAILLVRLAASATALLHKLQKGIPPWVPLKGFEKKTYKQLQEEAIESKRRDLAVLEANDGLWPGAKIPSHALFLWASGSELTTILEQDHMPNKYIPKYLRYVLTGTITRIAVNCDCFTIFSNLLWFPPQFIYLFTLGWGGWLCETERSWLKLFQGWGHGKFWA